MILGGSSQEADEDGVLQLESRVGREVLLRVSQLV